MQISLSEALSPVAPDRVIWRTERAQCVNSEQSVSRLVVVKILHPPRSHCAVPLLLRLSPPRSLSLIMFRGAMEGNIHGLCVRCCLGHWLIKV